MHGKFITFEGIDGSGKSTQLRLLASTLREREVDVITTCQPGGTPLGRRLREAFLETEENVAPMAELLLFAADRAQHVEFLIKPALAEGRVVISDRYADATFAYQGAGRGFDQRTVEQIIELATSGLKPDLTLYFDVSIETAITRMGRMNESDRKTNRMDFETAEFYERVRASYLGIAKCEPGRFRVINAEAAPENIHSEVVELVTSIL